MMEVKRDEIKFRLNGIFEQSFILDTSAYATEQPLVVEMGFDVAARDDGKELKLALAAKYSCGDDRVIECVYIFHYGIDDLTGAVVLGDDQTKIPTNFLERLLYDSLDILRGILFVKLQGLQGIPLLPNPDILEMINQKEKLGYDS